MKRKFKISLPRFTGPRNHTDYNLVYIIRENPRHPRSIKILREPQ